MKMINKGFSLIELLIVIAIVGILAGIAAPVYKSYLLKAKMSTIVAPLDGIMEKMIAYAGQHGVFANAYQLGLSNSTDIINNPGARFATSPSSISPYFTYLEIEDSGKDNVFNPCGSKGYIAAGLDLSSIDPSLWASVACYITHVSGGYQKHCYVTAGTFSGQTLSDSIIPGMISYYSNSNYGYAQAYAQQQSFLSQATCS